MEENKEPNLQSLKDFVETHKSIVNMPNMRLWIKKRNKNGAFLWIRRIGSRIFVDVDKFYEWTRRKK